MVLCDEIDALEKLQVAESWRRRSYKVGKAGAVSGSWRLVRGTW